jgi:hypothetical protein
MALTPGLTVANHSAIVSMAYPQTHWLKYFADRALQGNRNGNRIINAFMDG